MEGLNANIEEPTTQTIFFENKELFKNAPPYINNLTLQKRLPFINHTKDLPGKRKFFIQLIKISYTVKTYTIYS